MLPSFAPASAIVPQDLDAARWEALEPLYRELIDRDLHSAADLERLILDRSELDSAVSEAASVLYITMTCHTDDEAVSKAYLGFVEDVQPKVKEVSFELDKKIVQSPFAEELDQARYTVYLRDLRVGVELFRPENIPIETGLTKLDQEYSRICGAMTVSYQGEERTLPQMARFNEETDRAVREDAWRAVAQRRFLDADRIETIYERMIADRTRLARNAGFPDFRDYAFKAKRRFDYTPATCNAFAEGVKRVCVPAARRLNAQRAAALNLSSLRPWDMQVDIKGRAPLRPFTTPSELVERTSRLFRRLDPSLATLFEALRSDKSAPTGAAVCLDLESRRGKAPGGYQSNRDRIRLPFIFMNAAGLQRDVETIVHEAGHAFHSLLARTDPLLSYRSDIPLEFAEVASMSMELTAHPFLDEFYSPADADRARRNHLEAIVSLLAWVAHIDQFQHWVYTNPDHSRDDRHAKWTELSARFGPAVDYSGLEKYHQTGWHRVLHLFGVPFYYIEYGIAQLGALQLWSNYRRDPAAAINAYKRALSLGGSRPLPELFAAANLVFDFGPATIARLWTDVESELAKLPA
ncbi:MAG: M3 family oligoendopeptidase [Phycisphaeraceae bacterium]|nr:M3 family oligoendopeptidase [Phycisphaeraceae bacterium]